MFYGENYYDFQKANGEVKRAEMNVNSLQCNDKKTNNFIPIMHCWHYFQIEIPIPQIIPLGEQNHWH